MEGIEADELTEMTLSDARTGLSDNGIKQVIMAHCKDPTGFDRSQNGFCLLDRERHRFFHEDVAAGPKRRAGKWGVSHWWGHDMDGVRSGQLQQALQAPGHHVDLFPGGKGSCPG
jgi:hypothetical protein